MHLDEFLKVVGEFGPYQKRQYVLVCLVSSYAAVVIFSLVFFSVAPEHHCTIPAAYKELSQKFYGKNVSEEKIYNMSIPWVEGKNGIFERSSCFLISLKNYENNSSIGNATIPLNTSVADAFEQKFSVDNQTFEACPEGRTYSQKTYASTIVSEFDLKCENEWQISFSKSMLFIGKLVGDLLSGMVCDRFGRRPTFLVSMFLSLVVGVLLALSPVMAVYTTALFILGFLNPFYYLSVFTLGLEFTGAGKRNITGFVLHIFFGVGTFYVVLFAYFIRNWRHLALAMFSPCFLFGIYWFLLPESFRWLLSRGRTEEAKKVLNKVVEVNKAEVEEGLVASLLDGIEKPSKTTTDTATALDMVRTWRRAVFTLNICFNWLVNAMVYYGLSLNVESLGGSLYLNFILMGAIEIPAYGSLVLIIDRLGRRKTLFFYMVTAGVACIVSGVLPYELHWLIITTAVVGKMCISASFGVIYLLTPECYPTTMRIVALGTASAFGRVGSALAPQVILLQEIMTSLPFIFIGVMSITAGILSLFFPETVRRKLPQNTAEFDELLRSPIFRTEKHELDKDSSNELLDLKKDPRREKSDVSI
ncbi:organic cation transporter protein [Lingula anatina]|uniref:Organic cation transporter protein n=1 Tax=Lingula anatina TaxID=7574 RepID=A0A1S3H5E0_LINAN|nr:organic cation transporter protein [Lingula anatina]|eukprot:XP_013381223.1 organic cation transporter protein [Lingula anatina]